MGRLRDQLEDRLRPYVLTARRLRARKVSVIDFAYARQVSFSQFGEDHFLSRLFGKQSEGFYVDVGAYHPFNASNTLLLYRRGWRGINLEPDPEAIERLRRFRPGDVNLQLAVSNEVADKEYMLAGSFSGILDQHHQWRPDGLDRITVRTRPLADVLAEHLPAGREIDMLCVDCEGHDIEVLESNDWERFRPRVVLAEWHDAAGDERNPEAVLSRLGYCPLDRLGPSSVFADRSALDGLTLPLSFRR